VLDRDPATVLDLVVAARRIQQFLAELDFVGFSSDLKTQSAVIFQFLVLGEAAKRLSTGFRERHSEIGWSEIMRMRDKMIHHYEGIDNGELWRAATLDVPALLQLLEPLLPSRQG
jgi:uncharacterized protein with HEPN domain